MAPVPVAPDPAVEYANLRSGEGDSFREGYFGTGDDLIHYVEAGEGPVVVFVHGFPSFWYCWREQMECLRRSRRVVAIDAPGAWLSGKPGDVASYRVDRLAAHLDSFIEEIASGERVTLVGHDWGGALAWSYTKWKSDKVERLAVFSAPPYDLILDLLRSDPQQRAASDYMLRLRELKANPIETEQVAAALWEVAYRKWVETGVLTRAEGELFRAALTKPGALHGGAQWYAANIPPFSEIDLERDSWPSREAQVDVPVMLILGSEDRTFVKRMAHAAQDHADLLEVVTLKGVGHWTPFERPQLANAALSRFLGVDLSE